MGNRAGRGEDGAAMVEMAFAVSLLCIFLFGIITFGIVLAVKQTVTQAAAEGARAAVTAVQLLGNTADPNDPPRAAARTQVGNSASWLGTRTCTEDLTDGGFLHCQTSIARCPSAVGGPNQLCITVTVTYDWAKRPIIPPLPFISGVLPKQIVSVSTVALAGPCLKLIGGAAGLCA